MKSNLSDRFSFETEGEIALEGCAEDRELGDHYNIEPNLKIDLTRSTGIEFNADDRIRRFRNPDGNATNQPTMTLAAHY
jgi:hypothetical protein